MQLRSNASGQAGPGPSSAASSSVAAVGSTPNSPGYYKIRKDVYKARHKGKPPTRRSLATKTHDRSAILYMSPGLKDSDWMAFVQGLAAKANLSRMAWFIAWHTKYPQPTKEAPKAPKDKRRSRGA